jgi:hypothetical protein
MALRRSLWLWIAARLLPVLLPCRLPGIRQALHPRPCGPDRIPFVLSFLPSASHKHDGKCDHHEKISRRRAESRRRRARSGIAAPVIWPPTCGTDVIPPWSTPESALLAAVCCIHDYSQDGLAAAGQAWAQY